MRAGWGVAAVAAVLVLCGALAAPPNDPPPSWAFLRFHIEKSTQPPDTRITVPGSKLSVTLKQLYDVFNPPDWFPGDHPKPPTVMAHGDAPKLWACSVCHLATGTGDPSSAAIAGLPADYIVQQFAEFRSGRRQCAIAKGVACGQDMLFEAKAATDKEIKEAAAYLSHLKYHSHIHVVETAIVPKTQIDGFELARAKNGGTEPIGERILEVSDNPTLFEKHDGRITFTAYVPPGSIARGRALVASGAGAAPCAACHGANLEGMGMTPPLAGRPPSYIVRQLFDIQHGFRRGPAVALMEPEVAHMTAAERIDIAAYLASLGN